MSNIWQSLYLNIHDPLPVLPGNEQDLCHENRDLALFNTYLFYQVCKVHEIVCFRDQFASVRKHDTLASDISANTILAMLAEWFTLGKTRMLNTCIGLSLNTDYLMSEEPIDPLILSA